MLYPYSGLNHINGIYEYMTLPGVSDELTGPLPDLHVTKYNYWRDFLYHLRVDHTRLPGLSKERSILVGLYGMSISDQLILGLREGRLDHEGSLM